MFASQIPPFRTHTHATLRVAKFGAKITQQQRTIRWRIARWPQQEAAGGGVLQRRLRALALQIGKEVRLLHVIQRIGRHLF